MSCLPFSKSGSRSPLPNVTYPNGRSLIHPEDGFYILHTPQNAVWLRHIWSCFGCVGLWEASLSLTLSAIALFLAMARRARDGWSRLGMTVPDRYQPSPGDTALDALEKGTVMAQLPTKKSEIAWDSYWGNDGIRWNSLKSPQLMPPIQFRACLGMVQDPIRDWSST